jgi:hypothetical protein
MLRTTSQIRDTQGADPWVLNTGVRYVDDLKAILDNDLFRVRSVPGVAWAVNLVERSSGCSTSLCASILSSSKARSTRGCRVTWPGWPVTLSTVGTSQAPVLEEVGR